MLLDEWLPTYQFNEIHRVTVRASPEKTFVALKQLTWAELSPLVKLLLGLRALPARLSGKTEPAMDASQPMLDLMYAQGFIPLAESSNEIVFGLIGQFWKLKDDMTPPIHTPQEFLAFDDPAFAKVAANLAVREITPMLMECTTETRIYVPDPNTRKKFALYWIAIRLGSGLLRRVWLAAIKRRAERNE